MLAWNLLKTRGEKGTKKFWRGIMGNLILKSFRSEAFKNDAEGKRCRNELEKEINAWLSKKENKRIKVIGITLMISHEIVSISHLSFSKTRYFKNRSLSPLTTGTALPKGIDFEKKENTWDKTVTDQINTNFHAEVYYEKVKGGSR